MTQQFTVLTFLCIDFFYHATLFKLGYYMLNQMCSDLFSEAPYGLILESDHLS